MGSRRKFIESSLAMVGSSMLDWSSLALFGYDGKNQPEYLIDLHCHPARFFNRGHTGYTGDDAFVKAIDDMNSNKLNGAFVSIVSDFPLLTVTDTGILPRGKFSEGEGWMEYRRQISIIKELIEISEATIATKADDLTTEQVRLFLACEGADFIDNDLDHIDQAYEDGVRSIQLVHYAPNHIGDLQTWEPVNQGLTDFGKGIVSRMNDLGMIIDVAHASFDTVKDVVEVTDSPIFLSHSLLKGGNDHPISARAITKEHAKLVSATGGVIGAWPSGFSDGFEDFIDRTLKLIDTVGIDHVGLGTDMDANYKPVIDDYSGFLKWIDALGQRGMSSEEIGKIVGGNAIRVMKEVLKS